MFFGFVFWCYECMHVGCTMYNEGCYLASFFFLVKCKGFLELELDHKRGAIMVDMLAMSSLQAYEL